MEATAKLNLPHELEPKPFPANITAGDWMFAIALCVGAAIALTRFSHHMDGYDKAVLICAVPVVAWLAWLWNPMRKLLMAATVLSLLSIWIYYNPAGVPELARGQQKFFLKYLLSSQSAIVWMCTLFFFATFSYWFGLMARSEFALKIGSRMTWLAVLAGLTGMLVRWFESYLLGPDIGHIPVSNLYEVFILFCILTSLFYLYYEEQYATRALGPFVLLIIAAAVGFLLWYTFDRQAHEIQPLVPALQSWWMKIHVPANFIGYGSFALSAMVATAYLLAHKGILASRLPSLEVMDDVMYRSIAIGFAFFTVATILGALWAAEAWGSYWQWDPKETWALIVWLNYAAWLHIRLVKGLRGTLLAWWSLVGLLVTTFAFLGVNMFLSGLHSYGTL